MSEKFASQDPRVVSVFEIVGAYFTDTVFNHVHHSAKMNLAGGSSLTDEYVRRIQAYVLGVKNDGRCYSDVVQGVHTYFTGTTRFTTLSFAEFVDRVVGVCVPEEYFHQFSPQDKDELLSSVLCDLVSNLAAFATKPDMLRRIIDGHTTTPEVTIRMLQDASVTALITKRAALHNKFLRKMGQARDTVSLDVVDDMKRALRRLVKEKTEAEARAGLAEERADLAEAGLRRQGRDTRLREAKLLKLVELLRRGRDEGAAVVGTGLRAPRRDTLAEGDDPLSFDIEAEPPLSSEGRRERGGAAAAGEPPRQRAVPASFFQTTPVVAPRHQPPRRELPWAESREEEEDAPTAYATEHYRAEEPAPRVKLYSSPSLRDEPSSPSSSPRDEPKLYSSPSPRDEPKLYSSSSPPTASGSLFDNVVDSTGDSVLDDILYGRD